MTQIKGGFSGGHRASKLEPPPYLGIRSVRGDFWASGYKKAKWWLGLVC